MEVANRQPPFFLCGRFIFFTRPSWIDSIPELQVTWLRAWKVISSMHMENRSSHQKQQTGSCSYTGNQGISEFPFWERSFSQVPGWKYPSLLIHHNGNLVFRIRQDLKEAKLLYIWIYQKAKSSSQRLIQFQRGQLLNRHYKVPAIQILFKKGHCSI